MAMACTPWQQQSLRLLHRVKCHHLRPLRSATHHHHHHHFVHPRTPPHHPLTTLDHCSFHSAAPRALTDKKCVPCNLKELRPMTEDAAQTLMPQVAEWNMVNEGGVLKLRRSWKVKTFTRGLEFFRIVADLAENEGHHPDLHLVGWNNVTIEIWTHAVGGLTENDFILAAKIDRLNVNDLLGRKASD